MAEPTSPQSDQPAGEPDVAALEDAVLERLATTPAPPTSQLTRGDLTVDVYGEHPGGVQPVTVFVHGGYWRPRTDRSHFRPLAQAWAQQGFSVVLPEYRREPGNPGAALEDLLAVEDLLVEEGWYDAPVPAVWVGYSAGGHLALLRGTQPGRPAVGVVSLAGVGDLTRCATDRLGEGAATDWVGATPQEDPAAYDRLDPRRRWPEGGRPRTLLVHGERDATVPAAYAEDFPAPSWILPGAHHADLVDPTTPYAAQVHRAWMEVYAGMFAAAQEGA